MDIWTVNLNYPSNLKIISLIWKGDHKLHPVIHELKLNNENGNVEAPPPPGALPLGLWYLSFIFRHFQKETYRYFNSLYYLLDI